MTLKAFKAALEVGLQISVTDHWMDQNRHTLRTVTKIQTNGFFYTQEGNPRRCWMDYPKAGQLQFAGTVARIRINEEKYWELDLASNGVVDHYRWERMRGQENECDGERRMAEEAETRGANMRTWWNQWFERSDAWRDEIGHECVEALESPTDDSPSCEPK